MFLCVKRKFSDRSGRTVYEVSTVDKFEYKLRAEEIRTLISKKKYREAALVADQVDWKRVNNVKMLCTVSDLYKANRRFKEAKQLLLMANDRRPEGRMIIYSLCDLCIRMNEIVEAVEYYKQFVQISPNDTGKYILLYRIYEAQDIGLEERIAVLEEFKKRDYQEKWGYELAYLYHRIGLGQKCVEECDELVLWFGEGKYVLKAMELKMLHRPLSPAQQKKYDAHFAQEEEEQLPEKEKPVSEEKTVKEEVLSEKAPVEAKQEPAEETAAAEEFDIHIKTMDVANKYNTINLQQALAESIKEVYVAPPEEESRVPIEEIFGQIKEEPVIVKPVEETPVEEVFAVEEEPAAVEETSETKEKFMLPEGTAEIPAEFFPEEDVGVEELEEEPYVSETEKEEYLEDVSRVEEDSKDWVIDATGQLDMPEEVSSDTGSFREINDIYEIKDIEEAQNLLKAKEEQEAADKEETASRRMEQFLSQEYDGQISLVMPENAAIEKQITGQMSIEDIMSEWERLKKENAEKQKEKVKQRLLEHTGSLFEDFELSSKNGILEQLQKEASAEAAAIAEERAIQKEDALIEKVLYEKTDTDSKDKLAVEEVSLEEIPTENDAVTAEEDIDDFVVELEIPEEETVTSEPEEPVVSKDLKEKVAESEAEVEAETESDSEEEAEAEAETDSEEEAIKLSADGSEAEEISQEAHTAQMEETTEMKAKLAAQHLEERIRSMSKEEKALFVPFVHTKESMKQLISALDKLSLSAYTGNMIVSGAPGTDMLRMATNVAKDVGLCDSNFSGKIAKISSAVLEKKDITAVIEKIANGALIIEKAGKISKECAAKLLKALNQEKTGAIVILVDGRKEINRLLLENPQLKECFNARFDIEALSSRMLADYGCKYAYTQEFAVDEMGRLELSRRIDELQSGDYAVTVEDVREIVDEAIEKACRKSIRHFFDIVFRNRYDEVEDMIILQARHFRY